MLQERKEWRIGWAYQVVKLPASDAPGYEQNRKRCRDQGKSAAIHKRGYVKLWRCVDGEWQVVDRALTVAGAKRRAAQY